MAENTDTGELIADIREQVLYLQELGVESLEAKLPEALKAGGERQETREAAVVRREMSLPVTEVKPERPAAGSRLASLPSLSARKPSTFFDKYNPSGTADQPPAQKSNEPPIVLSQPETLLFESLPTLPDPTETIEQIRADIGTDCKRCKLCGLGRTRVVNSVGNFSADLMFVGEAPGADEDLQGEPFVGRAGQLLTDIIEKGLDMPRKEVFIGNINRCRPPGNRTPEPDESVVCKPFLLREIAVVRPKVIVVLGAHAAQNLLETKVPISKLRGHFHDHFGVKVMPTFHPAYLLRDPHKKREVWEDMKMVKQYLKLSK